MSRKFPFVSLDGLIGDIGWADVVVMHDGYGIGRETQSFRVRGFTDVCDTAVTDRLKALFREFAHVREEPDDPDHAPSFNDRLAPLTRRAEAIPKRIQVLFGAPTDFAAVRRHIVDSANE